MRTFFRGALFFAAVLGIVAFCLAFWFWLVNQVYAQAGLIGLLVGLAIVIILAWILKRREDSDKNGRAV